MDFQQTLAEHDNREINNAKAYEKLGEQRLQKQQERTIANSQRLKRQQQSDAIQQRLQKQTGATTTRGSFMAGMNEAFNPKNNTNDK